MLQHSSGDGEGPRNVDVFLLVAIVLLVVEVVASVTAAAVVMAAVSTWKETAKPSQCLCRSGKTLENQSS